MRRFEFLFILIICVIVSVLFSPVVSMGASRMNAAEFAIFCKKATLTEIRESLSLGSVMSDQALIVAAFNNPDPEVMKLLMNTAKDAGLDLAKSPKIGAGVLNSAIRGGRPEVVKAIIAFGVNVNASDKTFRTPLAEARYCGMNSQDPDRREIINIILAAGARR